jgi:hypothetical protein
MKKQAIIINFIVIFLTMTVNIGVVRCQENSNMINVQYQSKHMGSMSKELNEDNLENDKNIGVEILEWIIKRNLVYEYQKIDTEELEDRLERIR